MSMQFKEHDRVRLKAHPDVIGTFVCYRDGRCDSCYVTWPFAPDRLSSLTICDAIELVPPPKPTLEEILRPGMVIKRYLLRDHSILSTVNSQTGKAAVLADHRSGKHPVIAVYALGEKRWVNEDLLQ